MDIDECDGILQKLGYGHCTILAALQKDGTVDDLSFAKSVLKYDPLAAFL